MLLVSVASAGLHTVCTSTRPNISLIDQLIECRNDERQVLTAACGGIAENGKTLALSVHAALKGALLTLLRCRDGPAIPWHPKVGVT